VSNLWCHVKFWCGACQLDGSSSTRRLVPLIAPMEPSHVAMERATEGRRFGYTVLVCFEGSALPSLWAVFPCAQPLWSGPCSVCWVACCCWVAWPSLLSFTSTAKKKTHHSYWPEQNPVSTAPCPHPLQNWMSHQESLHTAPVPISATATIISKTKKSKYFSSHE
jgi:hypothetical protein